MICTSFKGQSIRDEVVGISMCAGWAESAYGKTKDESNPQGALTNGCIKMKG